MFNVIFILCIYPVLPIMYFIMANEVKSKKNIILGVTLSYLARQEEEVLSILKGYKTALKRSGIILGLIPLVTFFIPYFSVNLTLLLCWMIGVLIVLGVIFIKYNKKLKEYKKRNSGEEIKNHIIYVDTKAAVAAMDGKKLTAGLFILPIIISVIPFVLTLIYKREDSIPYLIMYGIHILLTGSFLPLNKIIYRQKSELVDNDTQLSAVLTRIRRYHWSKSFLMMAWTTAIFGICLYLFPDSGSGILVVTFLYTFFLLYYVTKAEFTTRKVQETLTADSGKEIYQDEDDYWIFGMIYHNPNDNHLMVNDRVGMGMSMNMAKPVGKIVMIFSAVVILLCPLAGVWTMLEELTPIKPVVNNSTLKVIHWKEEEEINLDSITEIELLETLPKSRRVVGTGMNELLKGSFDVEGIGRCTLYLNPKNPPFIKIQTQDETIIIGSDKEDILSAYEAIKNTLIP